MKTITLCYSFIKKNLIPIMITTLMMTISMFILASFIGEYNYATYTRDIMLNDNLTNGVYYMAFSEDADYRNSEDTTELQKEIMQYEACEHILTYDQFAVDLNDSIANVMIYDEKMRESFSLHVDKGRWLSEKPTEVEAVIGGVTWGDTKVGDIIELDHNITAKVVGIMGDVVVYPSFNASSNSMQDSNLLFRVNNTMVFLTKETIPQEKLEKYSMANVRNFYVVFKEEAGAKEKDLLMSYLESNGVVAAHDKIIRDSNKNIEAWISGALPLPLFLLIVSTISIISISTVVVKRAMPEYSRYYLIGCSKKRGIELIVLPLGTIFSIPCVLNIINIVFCPNLFRAGKHIGTITYLFEANTVVPLIIYLVCIIVILTVIPTLFYKKYSPLLFYRSNL